MYGTLRTWHKLYGPELSMILYPSDEFGSQELPEKEIPGFVTNYLPLDESSNVHLMAKACVNGPTAHPVWSFLKSEFVGDVEWNFDSIFLVDRAGMPVGRYDARQLDRVDADLQYLLVAQSG